jgi:putative phosphoesterase
MRIIFISDIHGNKESIEFLRKEKFDELIVLGDVYGYGFEPEKDSDLINELLNYKNKMICLKGNSDIDNANLFSPSKSIKFTCDGILFRCDHGNRFNYRNASFITEKGVLVFGHEHTPYIQKIDNMIYVCVGSIAKPRNGTVPSYGVYEKNHFIIYSKDHKIIDQIKI